MSVSHALLGCDLIGSNYWAIISGPLSYYKVSFNHTLKLLSIKFKVTRISTIASVLPRSSIEDSVTRIGDTGTYYCGISIVNIVGKSMFVDNGILLSSFQTDYGRRILQLEFNMLKPYPVDDVFGTFI
jgi:hypothetical protein